MSKRAVSVGELSIGRLSQSVYPRAAAWVLTRDRLAQWRHVGCRNTLTESTRCGNWARARCWGAHERTEVNNNSRCYEGIQRIYRNAIVYHIREKMKAEFGGGATDKVREPFKGDEWAGIVRDAQAPRQAGQLDGGIRDDFDLLSVNHFFNIFEKYWAVLAPESTDRVSKQAMLGWMKEIKTLRDPLSHPTEADFGREDSFRLLDCARRVLSRLGCESEAAEVMELMDQVLLDGAEEDQRALDHRLPSSESVVVDFIGRERELRALREWFADPTGALWALAGEGGKGKSAIAYAFAAEIQKRGPEPFQIVLLAQCEKTSIR